MQHGMHCLGCPSASGESIEDACAVHGIDSNKLIDALNAHLKS
jgi:hybrid cluster-associated redox disulfide protein